MFHFDLHIFDNVRYVQEQNRRTRFDPDTFDPPEGWQPIPLTFKDNKIPWVESAISIEGDVEIPVSTYIDLASREAVELLIRDGMKYELPGNLEPYYLGRGLSGDITGHKGRIASLRAMMSAGGITVVSTSSLVRYCWVNCLVRR